MSVKFKNTSISEQTSVGILNISIKSNVIRPENVITEFAFYSRDKNNESYLIQQSKILYNQPLPVGITKEFTEKIDFGNYGSYKLIIDTRYGNVGVLKTLFIEFSKDGFIIDER